MTKIKPALPIYHGKLECDRQYNHGRFDITERRSNNCHCFQPSLAVVKNYVWTQGANLSPCNLDLTELDTLKFISIN